VDVEGVEETRLDVEAVVAAGVVVFAVEEEEGVSEVVTEISLGSLPPAFTKHS